MKNLLITYNIVFLVFGSALFSNLHHLEHDHNHDFNHTDCEECIIIDNSSSYITDCEEVGFSNNNFNEFVSELISVVEFSIEKLYLSRAPPIS